MPVVPMLIDLAWEQGSSIVILVGRHAQADVPH